MVYAKRPTIGGQRDSVGRKCLSQKQILGVEKPDLLLHVLIYFFIFFVEVRFF